jgi:hypothetical protein
MGNPVWRAFVAEQMEVWLEFFRNNHVESYIRMVEQFIRLNPYYVPSEQDMATDSSNLLRTLLWNESFNESLSEKGMRVWLSSPFVDFIEELSIYRDSYPEIKLLIILFTRHNLWFERVYGYVKRMMVQRYGLA